MLEGKIQLKLQSLDAKYITGDTFTTLRKYMNYLKKRISQI